MDHDCAFQRIFSHQIRIYGRFPALQAVLSSVGRQDHGVFNLGEFMPLCKVAQLFWHSIFILQIQRRHILQDCISIRISDFTALALSCQFPFSRPAPAQLRAVQRLLPEPGQAIPRI